ncbi:transglutaminase-like cysteine peptidase [Bradyrhizobium sp. KB893862 SZCCT0404]|uniref:transglutaminase-like cysteine peptidase n=1 Tax=Bradyrhizobium sp. KB893862 SZCCT0404 TaxID=2807672 RepID=UPI001BAB4E10|nr:transglutaminase-like cysteine peptidase [Bradyrhizobium sp. KB893862 SZCCT0404]MBR1177789.1 transglutaminase-like cysteine peptidase [Bradyrhizobium sp. KB893862 SZCCT0404]
MPHLILRLRLLAPAIALIASMLASISPSSGQQASVNTNDLLRPQAGESVDPRFTFTINEVLAARDRERSLHGDAVSQTPSASAQVVTEGRPVVSGSGDAGHEPFGALALRAPEGMLSRKWRALEAGIDNDRSVLQRCRADASRCPSNAAQFLRLVNAVRSKSGRDRLEEANQGVNLAIRYVRDIVQHGEIDRWTPPLATFATAKGDCEDYAIAKYVALLEAGTSRDELAIILGRDRDAGLDHAVLAAFIEGQWYILDNRHARVTSASAAVNFLPLISLNPDGVHALSASPGTPTPAVR